MQHQNQLTTKTQYFSTQSTATEGSGIYFAGMELTPAPFVAMTLEKYTAGDYAVGGLMKVTLDGVLFGNNFAVTAGKLKSKIASLAAQHKCLDDITIGCGGIKIIESGAGWIDSYSFPQGDQKTWMNIIPYSITLNVTHNDGVAIVARDPSIAAKYGTSGLLKSVTESFSVDYNENSWKTYYPPGTGTGIEFINNNIFSNAYATVSYSLSAQGLGICSSGAYIDAMSSAFNAVNHRGSAVGSFVSCSGNGYTPSGWSHKQYNHTRKVDFNELEGTYSINGQYLIRPSGCSGAGFAEKTLLTLDTSADSSLDDGSKNVQINGSIRCLTEGGYDSPGGGGNGYGPSIDEAEKVLKDLIWIHASGMAFHAAGTNSLLSFVARKGDPLRALSYGNNDTNSGGWPNVGDDSANDLQAHHGNDAQQYRLVSKSIKRNHTDATIDFTLSYSNKNRHKIPHALWAEVNVDHELPSRRLVEHVVPGRGYPLMQDIMCDTQETYSITVNAQFEPRSNVHGLLSAAQASILSLIYKTAKNLGAQNWVRTGDNESVGNNGSYKRTVKLTRHSCVDGTSSSAYQANNMVIDGVTIPQFINDSSLVPPGEYIPADRLYDGHNP